MSAEEDNKTEFHRTTATPQQASGVKKKDWLKEENLYPARSLLQKEESIKPWLSNSKALQHHKQIMVIQKFEELTKKLDRDTLMESCNSNNLVVTLTRLSTIQENRGRDWKPQLPVAKGHSFQEAHQDGKENSQWHSYYRNK